MSYDNLLKLLLPCATLCLGVYLTALRSKISSERVRNNLHYGFYAISILIFLGALITLFLYRDNIFFKNGVFTIDIFGIIIILSCFVFSVLLFLFTRKNLVGKLQYNTSELDPIVNKFTSDADKKNIKLLAGDLNFFGIYPNEIDSNSQFVCLKNENFQQIQILCTEPRTSIEKIRYGKILNDLPQTQLRFYKPVNADVMIRGRMKTLSNVVKLLIYNKIRSGLYEAIETDTANSNGALYHNICNLIWELAEEPVVEKTDGYKNLYQNQLI